MKKHQHADNRAGRHGNAGPKRDLARRARAGRQGTQNLLNTGDDRITSDPQAAGRLAAVCGGLPLALRITAALLAADPALTVGELADQLADEVGRLAALRYEDGGTSAPSVAATFDLSYRHLDEPAARLFRLLAVNPGPDISTAAAALTGQPAGATRMVLGRLVRAHLVEPAGAGTGRWRMHDLLRLYARQLSGTDTGAEDRDLARDRLLDYYLDRAGTADEHLRARAGMPLPAGFAGRAEALAWLDGERPSLIAAVPMAAATGRDQIALRLPLSLGEYLDWRRRFDDWLTILAIGRDTARRLGDHMNEAIALNNSGIALREVRRFAEAITAHQDAAAIYRETGDRHSEGRALGNLGGPLLEVRRFDEAITAYQDAAAIYRETGDRHREGAGLTGLGIALLEVRRFDEAITACQDGAAIYRETGDRHGEGMALNNLGLALVEVRRFDEAITAYQDVAAIFRETADRHSEGAALGNLGLALVEVRRFDEAITACQEDLAICRETGDRHREGGALDNLVPRCGRCGGLTRRSPPARTPPRSTGRPATGTARVGRWATSASRWCRCGGSMRRSPPTRTPPRSTGRPGTRTARTEQLTT